MKKITKAVAAIMLTVAVVCATGCTKSDDSNNEGNNNGGNNGGGNQSNHEYVDLGLPSGTLWATCNVGATTPECYGDYFAWGETVAKTTYDWSTYKYGNGDYNQLTKYCNKSGFGYNGFTDNLAILQSGDDAATVNWGNDWRTPIREQWQELIDNTTSAWTTLNDVYGRVFYGNGQSLFLPAAGYCVDGSLDHAGSSGYYWSSSLYTSFPGSAWGLRFYSSDCSVKYYNRHCGRLVRAVRSAK